MKYNPDEYWEDRAEAFEEVIGRAPISQQELEDWTEDNE